jgi:methylmalonyl-CoA mutase cobalamin-binding subunit
MANPKPGKTPEATDFERKPTPWPPFDLAAFARDSERALGQADTAPEVLPSSLQRQLREAASRTLLLGAQLRKGALSRDVAALALRSELSVLEAESTRRDVASLAAIWSALRAAIEEIGGIAQADARRLEVIVLEEDPDVSARVALAVESLGHTARVASSIVEVARLSAARAPQAVLVGSAHVGTHASSELFPLLREVSGSETVKILVFGNVGPADLATLAKDAGIDRCFSAAVDVESIMDQLTQLLPEST